MRRFGSVQQKMPCVFLTEVKEEPSTKRHFQQYQVVATEDVNPRALESNIEHALATEKLDGTCCYVSTYKGEPYLWARLDRKPNKQADKRFKNHQRSRAYCEGFTWNVEEDFRTVPDTWIPAHGVQHQNGQLVPDENGHIPGWVPVEKWNKQYCWHASVVNYESSKAVVLRPSSGNGGLLEINAVRLSDLLEQTLELIGTNVNANPYGLGTKKHPVHVLVPHGVLQIRNPPPLSYYQLTRWFQESKDGKVEGIVWHCNDGTLMKLHRHHLGLNWPEGEPFLNSRPVVIGFDWEGHGMELPAKDLFSAFSKLAGQSFDCVQDIQLVN